MQFNLKTVSFGILAAAALVAAPLTLMKSANADSDGGHRGSNFEQLTLQLTKADQGYTGNFQL